MNTNIIDSSNKNEQLRQDQAIFDERARKEALGKTGQSPEYLDNGIDSHPGLDAEHARSYSEFKARDASSMSTPAAEVETPQESSEKLQEVGAAEKSGLINRIRASVEEKQSVPKSEPVKENVNLANRLNVIKANLPKEKFARVPNATQVAFAKRLDDARSETTAANKLAANTPEMQEKKERTQERAEVLGAKLELETSKRIAKELSVEQAKQADMKA